MPEISIPRTIGDLRSSLAQQEYQMARDLAKELPDSKQEAGYYMLAEYQRQCLRAVVDGRCATLQGSFKQVAWAEEIRHHIALQAQRAKGCYEEAWTHFLRHVLTWDQASEVIARRHLRYLKAHQRIPSSYLPPDWIISRCTTIAQRSFHLKRKRSRHSKVRAY
jgi:hypothetical protein